MSLFANDFDSHDPDTSVWLLSNGKEQVEQRRYSMRVYDLKEKWEWISREDIPNPRPFLLGKVKVKPIKDADGWYLELVEPDPRCNNTSITILHTRCNYGGRREWFQCQECFKRAGILYRDKGHYKCRKCLDLVYRTQSMNTYGFSKVITRIHKLEKMDESKKRWFYAGKDTKWFKKYKELNWKIGGSMKLFVNKISKE